MNRLEAITEATTQLDRCVRDRGKLGAPGDRMGLTLGEMDWLTELHRLLYEEDTEMLSKREQAEMVWERAASASKAVAFGMGGPELTVQPNPNSRGQADKDREPFVSLSTSGRAGVVEDACKAFARNKISGEEFERRVQDSSNRKLGIGGAPTRATTLPTGAEERKKYPVASGVLDYFPDAIALISNLSWKGNEQHNPGQPLHWARSKSTDEADTMLRHFLQRGTLDTDGIRHTVKMAWRALALLQKELE